MEACLDGVSSLDPGPRRVVVVLSGGAAAPGPHPRVECVRIADRLGFAAAVNLGIRAFDDEIDFIGLLNDDAEPPKNWLARLAGALASAEDLAAVQGTVTNRDGRWIDGRGIELDPFGLPTQVDRGEKTTIEPEVLRPVLAVSGTASIFRAEALASVSTEHARPMDPLYGSYHEDLDLGLRMRRLGLRAAWVGGAPTRHLGSATGSLMRWRHPWWILANRWRVLAANLTPTAFLTALPRLARGELRAVRTLSRHNPRTAAVATAVGAAWPWLVVAGWRRSTPGPRMTALPGPM